MPRREDDHRVRSDSTEQSRRHRGSNRHGRGRGEDRDRDNAERRDREPRFEGNTRIIAEENEPADTNRSGTRPDRHDDQHPRNFDLESTSARRPSVQTTDSLNRPSATTRTSTGLTTLAPPSNFPTLLSSLGIAFVSIPVNEYDKCRRFILAHPEILEQDANLYLREATAAHRYGKIQYARSCIQQALLIRELKGVSPGKRQQFFNQLEDEDPEVLGPFMDNFDTTLGVVQRNAGTTLAPVVQRPVANMPVIYSQALGGTARRAHGDNLAPVMSELTIQSTNNRPGYDPAPSNQGEATVQGQPDSGTGRHYRGPEGRPLTQSLFPNGNGGFAPRTSRGTTIRGTSGEKDLDPKYMKRRDAIRFFRIGRVFALLWHEASGNDRGSSTGYAGEHVYSSIRRMVVVRDDIHGACWAIPIHTYGNKGVAKRGFNQIDVQGHAVVYMTGTTPYTAPGEPVMSKNPIQVDPTQGQELEPMSRVNFTKVHTVEHEVKVLHIGYVSKKSMPDFEKYWAEQARPPN